jgi:hypothetical protein
MQSLLSSDKENRPSGGFQHSYLLSELELLKSQMQTQQTQAHLEKSQSELRLKILGTKYQKLLGILK